VSEITGIDRGTVMEFRGLRYATSERLGPPVDVTSWEPGLVATTFGPRAPQITGPLDRLLGADDVETSEDCLFLNVFTPARDRVRRPVLVFVHGGAFVTGSGSMPWYDGGPLAERGDVVVVTLNYRLGALGYLGDRNLGSLDQISALRWVHRNIGAFGGDPDRVTIFGESAGGAAVIALLAAPSADSLFQRVWAMSPSLPQLRDRATGELTQRTYLDQFAPGATPDVLLGVELADILGAQTSDPELANGLQSFTPTGRTDLFPGRILEVAAADPRPVVIGTNRDEMLLFTAFDPARRDLDDAGLQRSFERRFGERAPEAIRRSRDARPGSSPGQLVSAVQTDELFRYPAQSFAADRVRAGRACWMYLFDQTSSAFGGALGSCHGLDLPFAFHTLSARGAATFTGTDADLLAVADQFSDALISFARDGDPGWPPYDTTQRPTQRIGPSPDVVDDPDPELRELWSP
jgi:para-nitrobenzyl esterase